jgi:GNAT superfamily N-acetyltransferase
MYSQNQTSENKSGFIAGFQRLEAAAVLLDNDAQTEVLEFLERRPIQTAMLAGLIRDNGLRSHFNRGYFYGCRNRAGEFEGVALVGHATLFETSTDRALETLAGIAQRCATTHMIMGEKSLLNQFWGFYSRPEPKRRTCRERLLELLPPFPAGEPISGLRHATLDELDLILPIHAQMAFDESGVDPLEKDAEGFRYRYARRILKHRTWVWIDDGKPIFKAEIVSDTPQVAYLEGVWVNPEFRSQGQGTHCLLQLSKQLLSRSKSICVFVNENNLPALRFYERAGFTAQSVYDTFFLNPC